MRDEQGFGRVYGKPHAQYLAATRSLAEGRVFAVILTGSGFAVAGDGDDCPSGDVVWSVGPEGAAAELERHPSWEACCRALRRTSEEAA